MWQSQLSVMGKVFPIILPEGLTDTSLNVTLPELAEQMLLCSLERVQEVCQFELVNIFLRLGSGKPHACTKSVEGGYLH